MSLVRASGTLSWRLFWHPRPPGLPLVRSQSEFLRFVAGLRALFALLAGRRPCSPPAARTHRGSWSW
jgi:hypothetical protein